MMEKIFRSRGIRLIRDLDGTINRQQKIYYEPNDYGIENKQIYTLVSENILSLFEYSAVNERIDTYNFHVKLENETHKKIYSGLDIHSLTVLETIPSIFDESFRNYTVGYQIENKKITRSAYYYYPTIWKENRYGIKGIEDPITISNEIHRFAEYVAANQQAKGEIEEFGSIMYKLKGVSIHFHGDLSGFKLYGRCNERKLQELLANRMKVNLDDYKCYGDVALVAQRIQLGQIAGYNLYFMK